MGIIADCSDSLKLNKYFLKFRSEIFFVIILRNIYMLLLIYNVHPYSIEIETHYLLFQTLGYYIKYF